MPSHTCQHNIQVHQQIEFSSIVASSVYMFSSCPAFCQYLNACRMLTGSDRWILSSASHQHESACVTFSSVLWIVRQQYDDLVRKQYQLKQWQYIGRRGKEGKSPLWLRCTWVAGAFSLGRRGACCSVSLSVCVFAACRPQWKFPNWSLNV